MKTDHCLVIIENYFEFRASNLFFRLTFHIPAGQSSIAASLQLP